jgi:hypothetical protein
MAKEKKGYSNCDVNSWWKVETANCRAGSTPSPSFRTPRSGNPESGYKKISSGLDSGFARAPE